MSGLWTSSTSARSPLAPAPEVSIVVVTRNALRYCIRLFRSLPRTTDVGYEVVVVDNRSRPPTRLLLIVLALLRRINRLCLLDRNTLFAEGNNVGVSAASRESRLVLLLNSDVEIRDPRWLRRLIDAHRRGATALGFVEGNPIDRVDGYCFLVDRDLYLAQGLDETHQWWWGITRLQANLLRAGHEVRGLAEHDQLLVHFGGKSGRAYKKAGGMDVSEQEVIGWFGDHRAERLDAI
jgi:glycosyltransferase involved in cell wall biosynthesis